MTPEMADGYDKKQEEKTAAYKVPDHVRKDGCHYGRYLKEEEHDFIMTKENVVFFWAHMRAALAILAAHNLVFETSEEKTQ